jgi:predicted nucleic acid-binding protein
MRTVFADTGFYIAVGSPRDQHFPAAQRLLHSFRGRILTTEYVLLEVANFLSSIESRAGLVQLMKQIEADADTKVVASSHSLWSRGLQLYRNRPDKNWSLTDCISFVVMQDQNVTEALTADRHFAQAGFSILMD